MIAADAQVNKKNVSGEIGRRAHISGKKLKWNVFKEDGGEKKRKSKLVGDQLRTYEDGPKTPPSISCELREVFPHPLRISNDRSPSSHVQELK